ncbi:hypothetical protein [Arundinibacter roseus]|nr:hypothetical protein [Arundinibacter roseus]
MKSKLLLLILAVWLMPTLELEARNIPATPTALTKTEMDLGGKKKKRKRYKGYKKPRSKKFLGIFKRKSSCDCPK